MGALDVVRRLAGDTAASRLVNRASRLPSEDLVLWAETATVGIGKAFGDWQREGLADGLHEALVGTSSLLVVLEELERRRASGLL